MPKRTSRIWFATPQPILFAGSGPGPASVAAGSAAWRITNPAGMRCYTATGVVFKPDSAAVILAPAVGSGAPKLWISEVENPLDLDAADRAFPIENLIGTSAAPLLIPTDTALLGKAVSVQSAARWLRGVITWTESTPGNRSGTWYAFARWWAATDMCDSEWHDYEGQMLMTLEAGEAGNQSVT